jgi:leucyl aminopeptidase
MWVMTDLTALLQPDLGQPATQLHLTDKAGFDAWLAAQPDPTRTAVRAQGFKSEGFQLAILPRERAEWAAVLGVADASSLSEWCLAKAAEALPEGMYRLAEGGPGPAVLGWLLGQYRFDRFRKDANAKGARVLLTKEPARIEAAVRLADATFLVRDLVNLPAGDLGPAELERAAAAVAALGDAKLNVVSGTRLAAEYPMVHAVGAAATPERAPRLIEFEWGRPDHPKVAIIGKGVVFDTGGLDIKPASGMRLMKKDMGGAAHALALAQLVMQARLPVRLHVLVPAVENAVAGAATRPGDVLRSRAGMTVEIHNTDAEGRLILADALTRAGELKPELILDFATLTGAARVALGPDLPALFANDDALAADLVAGGEAIGDRVWRMPLWQPYEELIASDIADIANAGDSPFAGSVTAALFLQKFVPAGVAWAHFDTFAWRPAAKPGRPKGGDALGLRAAFELLKRRYSLSSG